MYYKIYLSFPNCGTNQRITAVCTAKDDMELKRLITYYKNNIENVFKYEREIINDDIQKTIITRIKKSDI